MHALYTVAIFVVFVLALPYFLYQAARYRKYVGSLPQRLDAAGSFLSTYDRVVVANR